MYFLEYGIGLSADAPRNELAWRLESKGRTGCERFRFNGHVITLVADASSDARRGIEVESDGSFRLRVIADGGEQVFQIQKGKTRLTLARPKAKNS
jgi:hypothetical protein